MPGPRPADCIPLTVRIVGRGLDPSAAARGLAALQAHRSPVARYDSYPQPGGINPPLRLSPVGAASPTPRRSAAVNGKDVGRPAAFPQRVVCLTRAGRACPAPTISPLADRHLPGVFFVGLLIFIQPFILRRLPKLLQILRVRCKIDLLSYLVA